MTWCVVSVLIIYLFDSVAPMAPFMAPFTSGTCANSTMGNHARQWGKNQSGKVAPRAKGQHPLRLRQCEPDLVLTGLTRLLQIERTSWTAGHYFFITIIN